MRADPIYRLEAVRKAYGERTVLEIERLDIVRGETLAVIGPSGAGKSTLLRLLQFLEPPSSGRVTYDGHAVQADVPIALRRQVTTVFQRPMVLDRSVRANLEYGLRLRGRRDGAGRLDELLRWLGLDALENQPARKLSGGEIQRVAFGRALAFDPSVLLLDEPTANLDPRNVRIVEALIRDCQARGMTIVLATHQIFQARRLADRTVLLLDGRVIEVGPTAALLDGAQDPRTRAFLTGDMVY